MLNGWMKTMTSEKVREGIKKTSLNFYMRLHEETSHIEHTPKRIKDITFNLNAFTGARGKLKKLVCGVQNPYLPTNRHRSSPTCRQIGLSITFSSNSTLLIFGKCADKRNIWGEWHPRKSNGDAPVQEQNTPVIKFIVHSQQVK